MHNHFHVFPIIEFLQIAQWDCANFRDLQFFSYLIFEHFVKI
jgi:hypothetical protein